MVGANLKAETFSLMEKRTSLEAEMNAIIEILCGPGGPGISGNLVDAEGFPRSDIDIPAVRSQRHRLAELRNDHKDITAKIDRNLELLHSVKIANNGPHSPENSAVSLMHDITSQASPMDEGPILRVPFAIIDEISDASPAAEDGLQLGLSKVPFKDIMRQGSFSELNCYSLDNGMVMDYWDAISVAYKKVFVVSKIVLAELSMKVVWKFACCCMVSLISC
ncbi:hypothetical protein J5N97_027045 [Dioscorea zingiberensis]|uniref:Nas2 N-terminal domain-containing protein n=1 Tax=Dioscorea zingiberensis TaxID=325984 RepID=A0A9D5C4J7_9LILI|nr:hypothetical protein J5N97_027045 [Dioscorea zingiberensis]